MSPAHMIEQYPEYMAGLYDRVIGERTTRLSARVIARSGVESILAESRPHDVLDVGCGGGQTALSLKARFPALNVTGVDLSSTQIERARERARRQGLDARFEVANAQALPFPDDQFDIVLSFGSVKHWPDPLQGIGECWRVLRPGGTLLLLDNTSDATPAQIAAMYQTAGFPRCLEWPAVSVLERRMFRPARPMRVYETIAAQLGMPAGAVTHPADLPAFLFSTQKPVLT